MDLQVLGVDVVDLVKNNICSQGLVQFSVGFTKFPKFIIQRIAVIVLSVVRLFCTFCMSVSFLCVVGTVRQINSVAYGVCRRSWLAMISDC